MKKLGVILFVAVCLVPGELGADERIASEEFASASTLLFGPDNVTRDRLSDDPSAPHPFDAFLELQPDVTVHSAEMTLGPTDRGSLEDVVWLALGSFEEHYPGRVQDFTVLAFTGGGPEVRLLRTSSRPEATLQWYDGTNWNLTGAVIRLDRRYRLRTVMYLDLGMMDVYLRDEEDGKELALTLGASFRAFSDVTVRRKFSLGRPTQMKVSLAAWQLWRVGRSEMLRLSSPGGRVPTERADVAMRYAAPVTLEGDARRYDDGAGFVTYTLRSALGICDDMELTDISRWHPTARVQRQTSFRRSGKWSLGISEGPRPVDTELTLPHGDFSLKLHFLVPKELPANRQVYLVRFKDPETGAEPVGPAVYLDYGAAGDGRSFIICQLDPDRYYAEEVTVEPGKWYGLRLVSQRARTAYVAWFVDDKGIEHPINEGKPLSFFLGTDIGDQVQWRFFSIVSMRPGVTDWPKIEMVTRKRRVTVDCPEKDRQRLGGLTLRGLPRDMAKGLDLNNLEAVRKTLSNSRKEIDKNWPNFRITAADAAKLKDFVAFEIFGNVYMPWQPVGFAYNTNGTMGLSANYVNHVRGTPTTAGEFRTWPQALEKPRLIGRGPLYFYMLYVPPKGSSDLRAELRWIHPHGPAGKPMPIPREFVKGEKLTLDHPGAPYEVTGAAVLDGKCYVTLPYNGLAVYDGDWSRRRYEPSGLSKVLGSRHYTITGFTWDPWAECFWVVSTGRFLWQLDRRLKPTGTKTRFSLDTVAMAAGPDDLYFVTKDGKVLRYNRFLSAHGTIPMEKMFGGAPLFSAVACVDRFLYLATRQDSTIYPSHVICIDTTTWNPVFNVDLKETLPEAASMTTDGEMMHLFGRTSPDVLTFKLPPKHELAPQKTFIYIDDVELTTLKTAEDIRLLPDPSGGIAGWGPKGLLIKNPRGEGWVLRQYRGAAVYERSSIAYVGREKSQYGWLKLRTLEPRSESGMLNVDVRTTEGSFLRRVVILYTRNARLIRAAPQLYGRDYTVEEFFAEEGLSSWQSQFRWWSRHLEGPAGRVHLRKIRMLPAGKGYHEHVFSLEKDLGIKSGETINGILLSYWRETPAVLSVTLSPSEWTPPEKTSGVVTSLPVLLDEGTRRLDWLSWEQVPFDPVRGGMTMWVRTADEKYFMDRVPWTAIENRMPLELPLGRYVQWRLQTSTRDVWRPPGVARLVFGLSRQDVHVGVAEGPSGARGLWLLLWVPAAAAFAYFIIGRRAWWTRRKSR